MQVFVLSVTDLSEPTWKKDALNGQKTILVCIQA